MSPNLLVTSWSADGGKLYGHRFMKGFVRYWPDDVPLVVYVDRPALYEHAKVRYTWQIPDWELLSTRWRMDAAVHGWSTHEWPRAKQYSYLWDAGRFAVKLFALRDAARRMGDGILTWLDGDVSTHRTIPEGWLNALIGTADVAYLGRGKMHPETGYIGLRIPQAMPLLDWCCEEYLSERFRERLDGWTDCHIFRAGLRTLSLRTVNLTAGQYVGESHIWPKSPLADYLDHAKGRSRKLGQDNAVVDCDHEMGLR